MMRCPRSTSSPVVSVSSTTLRVTLFSSNPQRTLFRSTSFIWPTWADQQRHWITRAIPGARPPDRLRRSRLQSCKRSPAFAGMTALASLTISHQRTLLLCHALGFGTCGAVDALVFRMARMPAHPRPAYPVFCTCFTQALPQFLVLDRLFAGGLP